MYQKAIAQLPSGTGLDVALTQMLGFSPTLLAINVVRKWELPVSLFQSMVDDATQIADEGGWSESDEVNAISNTLSKICKTGEALARANNPKFYPTAATDWEFARVEIEQALGTEGMKIIKESLAENCRRYVDLVPHVFTPAFVLDPVGKFKESQKETMLLRNPYVGQCRSFLQKKLITLYEAIRPQEVSRENLNLLAKDIIPSAGFAAGCVYTIDPASQLLVPQLSIGDETIKRFSVASYEAMERPPSDEEGEVVAEAFKETNPIVRQKSGTGPTIIVAGPVGYSQRIGVLYLEIRHAMFEDNESQHLLHFKAITQALNDCLNLK